MELFSPVGVTKVGAAKELAIVHTHVLSVCRCAHLRSHGQSVGAAHPSHCGKLW